MLSADVANYVGNPGLPMNFHRVEDRGLGVLLNGFNITYLQGTRISQWILQYLKLYVWLLPRVVDRYNPWYPYSHMPSLSTESVHFFLCLIAYLRGADVCTYVYMCNGDFSIPLTRSARVSTLGQLFRQQPLDSPLSERSGAHATAVRKGGCWKVNLRRRYKNRITVFVQSFDFVILKTSKLGEELELFVSSWSPL